MKALYILLGIGALIGIIYAALKWQDQSRLLQAYKNDQQEKYDQIKYLIDSYVPTYN